MMLKCSACQKWCKNPKDCLECSICSNIIHVECIQSTSQICSLKPNGQYSRFECNEKNMNNFHLRNLLSTCRYSNSSFTDYYDIHLIKDKIPKQGVSVLHVNIRSLIKNMSKLEELILDMSLSPDLFAISETKTVNVDLPGYNFFSENSMKGKQNSKYAAGGVGMFVKKSLSVSHTNSSIQCNACEDLWLELALANQKKLVFGVTYRHPHSNINEFRTKLCIYIDELNSKKKLYNVCGVINLDLLKQDTEPKIKTYVKSLNFRGYTPVTYNFTRITNSFTSLIDHVYINDHRNNVKCYILLHDLSDHMPVFFTTNNKALIASPLRPK